MFNATVDGVDKSFQVLELTNDIRTEGSAFYSKVFHRAVADGAKLKVEVDRFLEARGLTNLHENELKEKKLRSEIRTLESRLMSGKHPNGSRMSKEEGRELALLISRKRREANSIGNTLTDFYASTAERIAQNEQWQFFVYSCLRNADGSKIWNSYEDFQDTQDNYAEVIEKGTSELIAKAFKLDPNYEKRLTENAWLIRMKFMNQDLQLINSDGHLVDEDGRLIDSEGRFVNKDGQRVNIYGDLVDEWGQIIFPEDGWLED